MNRFHPSRFLILFPLTLLLGVSGCNGIPKSERKIFNEMRYTAHLYSVDNTGDKRIGMHRDVKQKDLEYMCRSTPNFTRACHIVSMLPVGLPNFPGNYIRVIPTDIVVPGYSSLPHTMVNGRDTVLLLPKPTH